MIWRALLLCIALATPLWAVEPDEVLDDPALENRARALSQGLRCPVCRNESIDESNAELARELRLVLRERLVAGDTNDEVMGYMVARYGEYVVLRPDTSGINIVLWLAAPAMLIAALGIGALTIRQRAAGKAAEPLSEAEKARLEEIMRS